MNLENKKLIEEYPFLRVRSRWSGKVINNDYEYTELDSMPTGWRKAFGLQMMKEIKDALIKEQERPEYTKEYLDATAEWYGFDESENTPKDLLHIWMITDLKEKWGSLRLYSNFESPKIREIIKKYSEISCATCIHCGKPATKMTTDWISPYCDECAKELGFINDEFGVVDIDEYTDGHTKEIRNKYGIR